MPVVEAPDIEALIVGAGPAGLATAIGLARRGQRAVVVERRSAPLDKACGEGLMPMGVRQLADLGVDVEKLDAAPFRGIRFVDARDGRARLTGRFATGPGLGIRRTELSRALLEAARRAGIQVVLDCALERWRIVDEGTCVVAQTSSGEVRARYLVGADGLNSAIRAQAGLARAAERSRRFGVRSHFRLAPWSDHVEVHWADGAEAYVTPVAPDAIGVAFLWRGKGVHPRALLARFPALAERLRGAEPIDAMRGAGPFWQGARARFAGRVALVGDAAGYTDAVTGEGVALALRSADALASVVAAREPLARYDAAWRRLTRTHRRFARLLRLGVDHPRLRRAAFAALAVVPSAFETLLRLAAEELTSSA